MDPETKKCMAKGCKNMVPVFSKNEGTIVLCQECRALLERGL